MIARNVIALNVAVGAAAWSLALWLGLHRWEALDAAEIALHAIRFALAVFLDHFSTRW